MDASEMGQVAPRKSGRVWMAVGLVTLAVGAGAVVLVLNAQRPAQVVNAQAEVGARVAAPAVPEEVSAAEAAPRARANLPALGNSDDFVRKALSGLGAEGAFARWLSGGDLARKMASLLMSVSEGELPRGLLAGFAPQGQFEVEEDPEGRLWVKDATFARYDPVASFVAGLDARKVASAFTTVEPLLERAWREVAPPRLSLRQAAARATSHLLAVPVPEGDVEVVEKGAVYAYADPQLESLSSAQKQLLRLGPDNARGVQDKLREVRSALGLPTSVR